MILMCFNSFQLLKALKSCQEISAEADEECSLLRAKSQTPGSVAQLWGLVPIAILYDDACLC